MTDEIKKKQAERKLSEINAMINRSGATPLLLKRKAELEKEVQKHPPLIARYSLAHAPPLGSPEGPSTPRDHSPTPTLNTPLTPFNLTQTLTTFNINDPNP